jgi:carbonic anhydrase
MIDIIYRYDISNPVAEVHPETPAEARALLEAGNDFFAHMLDEEPGEGRRVRILNVTPQDLGMAGRESGPQQHRPFAIVVGCADARAPIELLLGQGANDLFVVRVAGNILGTESLGSIDYALNQLADGLRLIVVMGHTGCGAVSATVDLFLEPGNFLELAARHELRSIINAILPAVRVSYEAIIRNYGVECRDLPGFRKALIETSVVINAAMMASTLHRTSDNIGTASVGVVFGVYDLYTRHVGVLSASRGIEQQHTFLDPPSSAAEIEALAYDVVNGPLVRRVLGFIDDEISDRLAP